MTDRLIIYGLQYAVYLLEGVVVLCLIFRRPQRSWRSILVFSALFFGVDAVGRPLVLYNFGRQSVQYGYFYWLTDVVLALAAFVLICVFFHRACSNEEKMWGFVRLFLFFTFLLVVGITALSLSKNYDHLFTSFIFEFEQNLYFTCLVLNTLLYVLLQHLRSSDEELGLLVCGLGIQFAGPAAALALFHLTAGQSYAQTLCSIILPLCTLGMFVTWLYVVTWAPRARRNALAHGTASEIEEARAFEA